MRQIAIIIIYMVLTVATAAADDVCVIVNQANTTESLSQREIIDLYMGRKKRFSTGLMAVTVDQAPEAAIRSDFYHKLVGKSIAQIKAYWARLLFTGRAIPPRVVDGTENVIEFVRENEGAIGYIDLKELDESVRCIARVD